MFDKYRELKDKGITVTVVRKVLNEREHAAYVREVKDSDTGLTMQLVEEEMTRDDLRLQVLELRKRLSAAEDIYLKAFGVGV